MANFILKKTTPNDVLFILHSISNQNIAKKVFLTKRMPQVALPEEWALDVFFDQEIYNMYRNGLITFNDNEAAVKAAQEAGVYFDDKLDFTPSSEKEIPEILATLKAGNRNNILAAVKKYGEDKVKEVAISNCNELTTAVVNMLENLWKIQLTMTEA